jgi:hypothetical protein
MEGSSIFPNFDPEKGCVDYGGVRYCGVKARNKMAEVALEIATIIDPDLCPEVRNELVRESKEFSDDFDR